MKIQIKEFISKINSIPKLKSIILIIIIGLSTFSNLKSQKPVPGQIWVTPIKDLNLIPVKLKVPQKFRSFIDTNRILYLPQGWTAQVFCIGGFSKPRFMEWSPDSVLHISDLNTGNIYAMPDKNHDGIADTVYPVVTGVGANNLQFFDGRIYAANTTTVYRCEDLDNNGIFETKTKIISSLPSIGHSTRTLLIRPETQKLYVSIGSGCNVCRDLNRDDIEEYNLDGTGRKIYISGARNAIGMAIQPSTGKLWADNNGSDNQGNDIPPEWFDIVREGGFYGFPVAFGYQSYFNYSLGTDYQALLPITKQDSDLIKTMVNPAALIQAHSAPMQLTFSNNSMPSEFQNGAFMALRGSWNRRPYTGYKYIYLHFANPGDTVVEWVADFMRGFLTDSINGVYWGRPVGVAMDNNGALYFGSDDSMRMVVKVWMEKPTKVGDFNSNDNSSFTLLPNPATDNLNINCKNKLTNDFKNQIIIYDPQGNRIKNITFPQNDGSLDNYQINIKDLSTGVYYLSLISNNSIITKSFCVIK